MIRYTSMISRPDKKPVELSLDSWGVQHPEASIEEGMEQPCTFRDALVVACVLHMLYRFSPQLTLAHLACPVNALHSLIQTKKEKLLETPSYHVFDLFQTHVGNQSVQIRIKTPRISAFGISGKCRLPLVDAFASWNPASQRLALTLINLHPEDTARVRIHIRNSREVKDRSAMCLTADDPNESNTFDTPRRIEPRPTSVQETGNPVSQVLPSCSLTRVEFTLS